MKRNLLRPLVVGIACALASGNVLADRWADQIADSSAGVLNPGNALHSPDGNYADMNKGDTITVNFLDNFCLDPPIGVTDGGEVEDVADYINGFPDAPIINWANQMTLEALSDATHLDAVYCDAAEILSWADFGGVIGERKVKGNEKTQNVSFKGVAYSGSAEVLDGEDIAQVGWLEVNYRNGVSCDFFAGDPFVINQFYASDGDQRVAALYWEYTCSNEDNGTAYIELINSELDSFDVGGGASLYGVSANGTYYLPDANGKGRTKFRGAICIDADDPAYSVDGGSGVMFDIEGDANEPIPVCEMSENPALPENSGDLQWGEINIGGEDFIPF